jgi:hypothetical protein
MAKNNNPGRILKGTKATATLKGASGVWTLDEAMQLHRANAWPQPNLFQPVGNSLRLSDAKNTSLQRITTRGGNRLAWTFSIWFKKTIFDSAGGWPELIRTLSPEDAIRFTTTGSGAGGADYIHIYFNGTSSGNYYIAGVLKDPSAWYHLVVSVDTAQTTNTNRVKAWINGVPSTFLWE